MEDSEHFRFKFSIMLFFLLLVTIGTSLIYIIIYIIDEINIFSIPSNYLEILIMPTVILILYVFYSYVKKAYNREKWNSRKFSVNCAYSFFIIGLTNTIFVLNNGFYLFGLGVVMSPGLILLQINSIAGFWVLNNTNRMNKWFSSDSKKVRIRSMIFVSIFSLIMLLSSITPVLIDRIVIRKNYYSSIQYSSDTSESEILLINSVESTNISALFGTKLNRYPRLDSLSELIDHFVVTSKAEKLVLFGLGYYEIFEYAFNVSSFETGLKIRYHNLTEEDEEYLNPSYLFRNATEIYLFNPNNETIFNWTQPYNEIYDYVVFMNLTYDPLMENQSEVVFDYPVKLVHIYYSYDHLFGNVGGLFIKKNIWIITDTNNTVIGGVFQDRGTIAA